MRSDKIFKSIESLYFFFDFLWEWLWNEAKLCWKRLCLQQLSEQRLCSCLVRGLLTESKGLLSGIEDTTWKSEEGVGELTLLLTNGKATFTTTVLGVSVASSGNYRISGNKITFSNFTGVLTSSVNNKEFDYRRDGDTLTLSQNGIAVYKFKKT